MATIYDIAKHVGVSAGTVSRALSRPDKVLPATRARIEQAAAALGYVPNTVARTLKTHRSGKILVTVPDIANPFFAQILQGAEDAAQAVGYAVLLGDTQHQPDREERYAHALCGPVEAMAPMADAAADADATPGLASRVEALEAEVAELRAQLEQLRRALPGA